MRALFGYSHNREAKVMVRRLAVEVFLSTFFCDLAQSNRHFLVLCAIIICSLLPQLTHEQAGLAQSGALG